MARTINSAKYYSESVADLFSEALAHLEGVKPLNLELELASFYFERAYQRARWRGIHKALFAIISTVRKFILAALHALTDEEKLFYAKIGDAAAEIQEILKVQLEKPRMVSNPSTPITQSLQPRQMSEVNSFVTPPCEPLILGRMGDGIEHPARLDAAIDFVPKGFVPKNSLRGALLSLAPCHIEQKYIEELLEDFHHDMAGRDIPAHMDSDDVLAIYAYTYEIKERGSATQKIMALPPERLYARVNEVINLEGRKLSPWVIPSLQHAQITANELLDSSPRIDDLSLPSDDIQSLQILRDFLSRPENDDSHPFQIYREMNAAMRNVITHPDKLDQFTDLIYYLLRALKKLPLVQGLTLYRGMGINISPSLYQAGSYILWQAFSSTSSNITVSTDFCKSRPDKPAVLFIIQSIAAYNVAPFSRIPKEAEYLLLPNTGLRIEGMVSKPMLDSLGLYSQVQVIEMRQVPDWQVDAERRVEQGAALIGSGNLQKGLGVWESVSELYPGSSSSLYAMASVKMWNQPPDLAGAKKLICDAVALDPLNPAFLNRYAQVLNGLGDAESSALMYRRALGINPGHYGTLGNYFVFLKSQGDVEGCKALSQEFCRSRLWSAQLEFRRNDVRSAVYNTYLALCSRPSDTAVQQAYVQALEVSGNKARLSEIRSKGLAPAMKADLEVISDRMVKFWFEVWTEQEPVSPINCLPPLKVCKPRLTSVSPPS